MHVRDLEIEDYFNFPNSSADGPEVDATVSFDVVWNEPASRRFNVRDSENGFGGSFVENQVTVTWSASNDLGFTFTANPGNFSTSLPGGAFAELGHEGNGIFFPGRHSASAAVNGNDLGAQGKEFSLFGPQPGDIGVSNPALGGGWSDTQPSPWIDSNNSSN